MATKCRPVRCATGEFMCQTCGRMDDEPPRCRSVVAVRELARIRLLLTSRSKGDNVTADTNTTEERT